MLALWELSNQLPGGVRVLRVPPVDARINHYGRLEINRITSHFIQSIKVRDVSILMIRCLPWGLIDVTK